MSITEVQYIQGVTLQYSLIFRQKLFFMSMFKQWHIGFYHILHIMQIVN